MSDVTSTELIKELEYLEERNGSNPSGFLPRRLIRKDKLFQQKENQNGPQSSNERMLRVQKTRFKVTRSASKRDPSSEVETD